jgi:hypothetical protein
MIVVLVLAVIILGYAMFFADKEVSTHTRARALSLSLSLACTWCSSLVLK